MIVSLMITLVLLITNGIYCDIEFQYSSEQCINQPVEYQCTVNGTGLQVLTWRIYRDNGTQFGSDEVYVSTAKQDPDTIGGVFTVEQLSQSPLISNISFTVQSSINGYTIVCEDNAMNKEDITISIIDPPPPPVNIKISVNQSSLQVTWTPPSYSFQCVAISNYSVLSNVTNSTITTTDTNFTIPLAGLSPSVYCVSVATVDTANRTGTYSDEECVELKVPKIKHCSAQPEFIIFNTTNSNSSNMTLDNLTVIWEFEKNILMLTNVSIYHNISGEMNPLNQSLDTMSSYTFNSVMDDTIYAFNVSGANIFGTGDSCICLYDPGAPIVMPTSNAITSSTLIITNSISSTTTNSATKPTSTSSPKSNTIIIISVVVPVALLCLVGAIIGFPIIFLVYKRKSQRSGVKPAEDKEKVKQPNTYNYADLEVLPSAKMEGAEKAVSEKKSKKSQKMHPSKPNPLQSKPAAKSEGITYAAVKHDVEYAEMSHTHGGPGGMKPRNQSAQQNVTYSSVKH